MVDQLPPLHPGEILREEFLIPLGLSAGMVARAVSVPRTRIERIVAEQTGISADTAIRLAQLFGTSPHFWMNAQTGFDLDTARARLDDVAPHIQPIVRNPFRRVGPHSRVPDDAHVRKRSSVRLDEPA